MTPGAVIGGDFEIERKLDEGGMGAVFIARQRATGKRRALKIMHAQLAPDERTRRRFTEEARIGSRIASDHVVEVIGAGVDDGTPWIAMELLRGENLGTLLAEGEPLDWDEVRDLFGQLGHALESAHQQGIVHRDLKPENLFLQESRRHDAAIDLKILDFGIAGIVKEGKEGFTVTTAIGSPLFMAPEQGTPGAVIGPTADVWAVGLIAFQALTGKVFWRSAHNGGGLPALLSEMMILALPAASERAAELGVGAHLPPGFDGWFARCVNRDATQRFQTAGPAIDALCAVLSLDPGPVPESEPATVPMAPPPMDAPELPDADGPVSGSTARLGKPLPKALAETDAVPPGLPGTIALGTVDLEALRLPETHLAEGDGPPDAELDSQPGVAKTRALPEDYRPPAHDAPPVAKTRALAAGMRTTPLAHAPRDLLSDVGDPIDDARPGRSRAAIWIGAGAVGAALLAGAALLMTSGESELAEEPCVEDARCLELTERCNDGEAGACESLGTIFDVADAVPQNEPHARAVHERGCELGSATSCGRLGLALADGDDPGRAPELLAQGCGADDGAACLRLARWHLEDSDPPARYAGLDAASRACELGSAAACRMGGERLYAEASPESRNRGELLLRSGCELRDGPSCRMLGEHYERHGFTAESNERAAENYQEGCELGDADACARLGWFQQRGLGMPQDGAEAVALYRRACGAESGLGCARLAHALAEGIFVQRDDDRARELASASCSQDVPEGCAALGFIFQFGLGGSRDESGAMRLYESSCDAGVADGCAGVGVAHARGIGRPVDRERSRELYTSSCRQGSGRGCSNWGYQHEAGVAGVARDLQEATRLYQRACDLGNAFGCSNLGVAYEHGHGGSRDVEAAAALYQRACRGADSYACGNLANLYERGHGVIRDSARASSLYREACDREVGARCADLARLYRTGTGVERDPARARVLMARACELGHQAACR